MNEAHRKELRCPRCNKLARQGPGPRVQPRNWDLANRRVWNGCPIPQNSGKGGDRAGWGFCITFVKRGFAIDCNGQRMPA
jgi:hypothetical protein